MDAATSGWWSPRDRARRVVGIVATLLLVIVAVDTVIDPNSIAVLIWGTALPPFPPTL